MITNWRVMFMVGALPALLAFYLQLQGGRVARMARQPRSPAPGPQIALRLRAPGVHLQASLGYLPIFLFLILLMTAFTSFSHGTQDLYPTFLPTTASATPTSA